MTDPLSAYRRHVLIEIIPDHRGFPGLGKRHELSVHDSWDAAVAAQAAATSISSRLTYIETRHPGAPLHLLERGMFASRQYPGDWGR